MNLGILALSRATMLRRSQPAPQKIIDAASMPEKIWVQWQPEEASARSDGRNTVPDS
jgi:hypothetical protein